ncbi:N-formylglutamate amidohydrolase [Candidatus Uhrbacteria bacterium]|nr:N-formylglutamate amidohydrolase [Candidatus Uhrbacteria bacterium]
MTPGRSALVLSVPHDGATILPGAARRTKTKLRDLGTLPLALSLHQELASLGIDATLVWLDLHRSHVDPNEENPAKACAPGLEHEFDVYHETLDRAMETALTRFGRCLLLDIHRCSLPGGPDIILGSDQHRTSPRLLDTVLAQNLRQNCSVAFSPDPTRGIDRRYRGGWIVRRAAKRFGTRGLDTVQLELNDPLWLLPQQSLARKLAVAITQSLPPRSATTHNEKQAPL